ncbi:PD-(D/E)XK nuclease family protein [Candidatus Daviesbacteria bacterium]|nr:PD-(D/E)XK nuclease family protein [Candidatus Daviesbacteria bacterium]
MPFNDGIPKINSYSLTDFHDFEDCSFRFFIRHHLDKKYEIDEGNSIVALGNLLDQSIKKFHKHKYYGCDPSELVGLVKAAAKDMREQVQIAQAKGKNHFYKSTIPFLNDEVITEAIKIFQDYYRGRNLKINQAVEEVGFCEWTFEANGDKFKLWGGPDCLEMGEDGIPEVVDYKSRKDLEKGKTYMDMDLMPKIYTLLCSSKLLNKGFKKARFLVRLWQDPKDESLFEEFDLTVMDGAEFLFKQKIEKILGTKEIYFCNKEFCRACQSEKKDDFLKELEMLGLIDQNSSKVVSGEEFIRGNI